MLVFEVDVHKALDWQCEQGKRINSVDLNSKSEFKESNQIKYELEKSSCVWQRSGEMNSDFGGGVEVGPKKDSFYWFERSI